MQIFAVIASLFVIGSLAGWIIELLFRRFFSQHKWMNPGFLQGPYLPIYGFGVIGMYGLSEIFKSVSLPEIIPVWLAIIIQIIAIGVTLIVIEFIAGLIFIKGLGLKLWDYSDRKWNTMGIVCPLFDLLWTIAGALYYFFLHPILKDGVMWLAEVDHNIYYLFIGMVLGMMIVDFAYSTHLASALVVFAKKNKVVVKLSEIQQKMKEDTAQFRKKLFFFPTINQIKETVQKHFISKSEDNQEGSND